MLWKIDHLPVFGDIINMITCKHGECPVSSSTLEETLILTPVVFGSGQETPAKFNTALETWWLHPFLFKWSLFRGYVELPGVYFLFAVAVLCMICMRHDTLAIFGLSRFCYTSELSLFLKASSATSKKKRNPRNSKNRYQKWPCFFRRSHRNSKASILEIYVESRAAHYMCVYTPGLKVDGTVTMSCIGW